MAGFIVQIRQVGRNSVRSSDSLSGLRAPSNRLLRGSVGELNWNAYRGVRERWKDSGKTDVQEYITIPAYCQCRHGCAPEYHRDQERDGAEKEKKIESVKFDQSEREERRMKENESAWLCIVVLAIGRETKQCEREGK